MKIEFHNNLGNPQCIPVTRVLVLDEFDNPIALAVDVDGTVLAATAEHADFNAMLRNLGINKTVIVHKARQVPLAEMNFGR